MVTEEQEAARIHDLARATLSGEFGVGEARKKALGKDYEAVSREVRRLRLGDRAVEESDPVDHDHQEITDEELDDLAGVLPPSEPTETEGIQGYKE